MVKKEKLTAWELSFLKRRVGMTVDTYVANTQHQPKHTGFQKGYPDQGNELSNKDRSRNDISRSTALSRSLHWKRETSLSSAAPSTPPGRGEPAQEHCAQILPSNSPPIVSIEHTSTGSFPTNKNGISEARERGVSGY